jgi:hypothetical protein
MIFGMGIISNRRRRKESIDQEIRSRLQSTSRAVVLEERISRPARRTR